MRAHEIMESSKKSDIDLTYKETMPPTITVPDMDQYYEFYRFMVGIAGMPDREIPLDGPISDGALIAPYSKQELDHVVKTVKKMGKTPKFITKKPSVEPDSTYSVSPVRKFIDYK